MTQQSFPHRPLGLSTSPNEPQIWSQFGAAWTNKLPLPHAGTIKEYQPIGAHIVFSTRPPCAFQTLAS
jgi:hypothetical protein